MPVALPREAFPLTPEDGRLRHSGEPPTGPATRPWALRFAGAPDATQATVLPDTIYDEAAQMSVGLYEGPLPFMETHTPTVPDGNVVNPPPLDEGAKD
ncbi:putative ATP-grasp-modified RiPP [Streptomyces sp. NPDC006923]|uniref:putative ATP-grasp-modified RiPP n=1 Tax=Streptomyces sp. NPDC006923 TaxID=3155355 RepID=UPI0033F812FA